LQSFVADNAILAVVAYMVIYAVMVSASLPGATVFTVAGGFLFGSVLATLYTVVAATFGATVIFLAAKTSLGDALRNKAGGRVDKLLTGFQEDAFNYLLVLRLVPVFPFFLVNIAPAFASVSLRVYVAATFLGIIPGTFVYSQVGTGLGSIFESGQAFTLGSVLTPEIIIALIGLAVLSVIPVLYKRLKRR
ncbi:MAG: VTT domain-containing protein, partial [Alphaproteobacteria bacterium]|nr:VTT domain-containing protein [Alphaproteobacteria bacterium]